MPDRANVVRALLLGGSIVLLLAALLYNEWLLAPLARDAFSATTVRGIRLVQLGFAGLALLLYIASETVRRSQLGARIAAGRAPALLLLMLAGLLPFLIIDFGLRPFVSAKTTIFVEDRELGWRMREEASGTWGGIAVRTNRRGLRGPDVPDGKPAGVRRLLFLGDSVTFGYGIADTAAVYPFVAGEELATRLPAPVEVVNAGVGGYSPWQERLYLEREGLRLAPDLVVVGFVLNDVTEKLSLVRYGGTGRGWQLARTARGTLDRWLSASALATWLRGGAAVLRFGRDVRLGALAQETADVRRLATDPLRPEIQRGWSIALENLAAMHAELSARDIPLLLVAFPYAFQLEDPGALQAPQRRLRRFAREHGIELVDLLHRFASDDDPHGLMLDASHPSQRGHGRAAMAIAQHVLARQLVAPSVGTE